MKSQIQHTPSLPIATQKSQQSGVLAAPKRLRDLSVFRVNASIYKQKATKINKMIIITILALSIITLTGCIILMKTETKKQTEFKIDKSGNG